MSTNLDAFRDEPTKKNHGSYNDSLFTFTAPEYSTAEVLLGSLYRKLILDVHDKDVDLETVNTLVEGLAKRWSRRDIAEFLLVQRGGLASPIRSGQKGATPYPQLMPLVPQIARYACVLGKKRNRWYPGDLALDVIGTGLGTTNGNKLINHLQAELTVASNDSVFSRFVAQELDAFKPPDPFPTIELNPGKVRAYRGTNPTNGHSPAEQFCHDIDLLLPLKMKLTRRQWTVLLEAMLRLGLPTHVLWVCHINIIVWNLASNAAAGATLPTTAEVERLIWSSHRNTPFLETGRDSVPAIKQLIERFVVARFGLNLILYRLEEAKVP